MNSRIDAIWLFSEMNSKAEALTARVREPRDARDARVHHRALVNQSEQRGPRRHVQDRDHIQRVASAPRRSGLPMPRHLDAKCVESGLSLAVVTPQPGQDR